MKTSFKVLTAMMGLGLVILLGLHLFLQYGLTRAMRDVVLPRIKAETGIDVEVGRLSINLPNGLLYLSDVSMKNPEGFLLENLASIGRVRIEIDLHSLIKRKPIVVKNVEVEAALLNVIRNKDGAVNLNQLQGTHPPAAESDPSREIPAQKQVPESATAPPSARAAEEASPLPEVLIQGLSCNARIRYLDFRLDQLDVMLDLGVSGSNLSNRKGASHPWGDIAVIGSLGDDRTSFITDIKIRLAPLADPAMPSFDLTGKVMEIDPRIMEEAYSKLSIRSAPFGLDPVVHCRESRFVDSVISLNLRDIEFEDKLADDLGGMASIGSLSFAVPLEGSLQDPVFDPGASLRSAFSKGNAWSILGAFLQGAAAKESGIEETPETIPDAAVELLGAHVEEIGENEEVKDELKSLGKWLFGK